MVQPDSTLGATQLARAVRVFIVDDHLLVAEGVAAALTAADGISVVGIAGTCADALREVSELQPDVMLLDQRLPDGLGTDIITDVFAGSPATKIVLLTAETSDAALFTAVERGCVGYVRKGARASELIKVVRGVARNESMIATEDLLRLLPRLRGAQRLGDDLTPREAEILQLLVNGASTEGIADELVIAPATARNHVQAVLTKLGAHSRLEAVSIALRERIGAPPH